MRQMYPVRVSIPLAVTHTHALRGRVLSRDFAFISSFFNRSLARSLAASVPAHLPPRTTLHIGNCLEVREEVSHLDSQPGGFVGPALPRTSWTNRDPRSATRSFTCVSGSILVSSSSLPSRETSAPLPANNTFAAADSAAGSLREAYDVMERVERAEQGPGLLHVDNETTSTARRVTVDGRTIVYKMTVIQQPQRARACGQGAKSSADRRPVDPPPIVELKIFEGENEEHDITFSIHANYFLYAELQNARVMAQGRVSQERTMPPVLTGTPVAGIAYLDRPSPAGYFIFPDLSVRHEGKYRLSFSLFEELKDPKDADKPAEGAHVDVESHVTHRLEVKSEAFTVFSAKKFPGLSESTPLSRMVAEQGCRVRIRRDVRMRRRDPKSGGKDWDEYEEETAQSRARMSATPDRNGLYANMSVIEPVPRPRSPSNSSLQSNLSRRPSLQDIGQPFPSQYGTPQGNSNFGQPSPYGPAPGSQLQQAPMPPPPPYSSQPFQPPSHMSAGPAPHHSYYGPAPVTQNQYANQARPYEQAPTVHRSSVEYPAKPELRRASGQYPVPAPPPPAYQAPPSSYSAQMSQPPPPPVPVPSYSQSESYSSRPTPLEPMRATTRTAGAPKPTSNQQPSFNLPPLNTTIASAPKLEASSPISTVPPSQYLSSYQTSENNKRPYGRVFSDQHQNQPLRHGARPASYSSNDDSPLNGQLLAAADDDDDDAANSEFDMYTTGMHYRRADGRTILRALHPQA